MRLKNYPGTILIHTHTEAEAKELLRILHESGCEWSDHKPLTGNTYWDTYGENTVYIVCVGLVDKTDMSVQHGRRGHNPVYAFARFKELFCEEEKPQPKFKVGDRVWAKIYSDQPPFLGTITFVRKDKDFEVDIDYFKDQINKQVWCCRVSDLEPYTEPETKEETMETKEHRNLSQDVANCDKSEDKQLNLCELLKGHEGELFYALINGDARLMEISDDEEEERIRIEYNNYESLYWLRSDGKDHEKGCCLFFPSRALYEQYPLDPYTAWMKWKEEQKKDYGLSIVLQNINSKNCEVINGHTLLFHTAADRDKCISEIKAIIEKYSKK